MGPLLESITSNAVPPVEDLASQVSGTPLFVVAGACPNSFCGMQAVLYSLMLRTPASEIDFWWIKPTKADPALL